MKILVINDCYLPLLNGVVGGGLEKVLIDQCKLLAEYGHQVTISTSGDSDFTSPGVSLAKWDMKSRLYYSSVENKTTLRYGGMFSKHINSELSKNYDLIISHTKKPSMLKALYEAVESRSIPVICYIHNLAAYGMLSITVNTIFKKLNDLSNCIVVGVSEKCMIDNTNLVEGCCSSFHILQYADTKLEVLPAEPYITIIARSSPNKNLPLAVEAACNSGYKVKVFTSYDITDRNSRSVYKDVVHIVHDYRRAGVDVELFISSNHDFIMSTLSRSSFHLITGLVESASVVTFEASMRGVPTVYVGKKGAKLAQEEFVDNYGTRVEIDRMRYQKCVKVLSDAISSLKIPSLEDRENLANRTYEKFSKEKYMEKFYNLLTSLNNSCTGDRHD